MKPNRHNLILALAIAAACTMISLSAVSLYLHHVNNLYNAVLEYSEIEASDIEAERRRNSEQ